MSSWKKIWRQILLQAYSNGLKGYNNNRFNRKKNPLKRNRENEKKNV